jgi:hypothetical protein
MENPQFPAITVATTEVDKLQNITSVRQAAVFLVHGWPVSHGKAHVSARAACLAALDGHGSSSTARAAFIDAAKEADIFVRDSAWPF